MSQESLSTSCWDTVKATLGRMYPAEIYQTWLAPIECLEETDEQLTLSAPTSFSAIWIEDNYIDIIRQRLGEVTGREMDVRVQVRAGGEDGFQASSPDLTATRQPMSRTAPVPAPKNKEHSVRLNPRNTFENFIVGSCNQFAHAACMAVAKSLGKAYNPIFLYGDTGLGKTHLMHAVAHYTLQQRSDAKIVYTSSEKFTNEFIRALQENTLVKFRRFYRSVDLLLIDDIQFLAGKERIQEEFFHTFNELFDSQRQICLSSDRPAGEISKLEGRLSGRFVSGMVADVQPPDLETRMAILRKKAAAHTMNVPDEVLHFIAQRITRNVRKMEGALTRVASYSVLTHSPIDLSTAERLLQDILLDESREEITIEKVQKAVVEYYQLRMGDMTSRRRPNNIAFPRQIAMYLCRQLTPHSLKDIGDDFGGRDHGTVIHATKTVEDMMDQDPSVRRAVDYLTKQLTG